jgi:hypothetical protein
VKNYEPSPLRLQTGELVERLLSQYGGGAIIGIKDVLGAYKALAAERGWNPMPPIKLGRQLTFFGVVRLKDERRQLVYVLPSGMEKRPAG